jgi:uncharacterized protein
MTRAPLALAALILGGTPLTAHETAPSAANKTVPKVLVYSNTGYYRHPEIPKINRWLVLLGHENGFEVDVTEHWKDLQPEALAPYDVLLLNNANELDLVLPEEQRKAVEAWFATGKKGIVGLHAALVHQTKWPWLNQLGGCDFNSDSDFTKAKVTVDPAAKDHPAVKGQPAEFWIEADWTNHDRTVTGLPGFQVLLRVDESTYTPVRDYFPPAAASRWAKTTRSPGFTNRTRRPLLLHRVRPRSPLARYALRAAARAGRHPLGRPLRRAAGALTWRAAELRPAPAQRGRLEARMHPTSHSSI